MRAGWHGNDWDELSGIDGPKGGEDSGTAMSFIPLAAGAGGGGNPSPGGRVQCDWRVGTTPKQQPLCLVCRE
mgnify:CR=1 FL=1